MWLQIQVPLLEALISYVSSTNSFQVYFSYKLYSVIISHVQGVLKVRKRVTLTVVIISAVFAVSWGAHSILHVIDDIGSYKLSPVAIPISHVMIMLNSAINPFAYALINKRFRDKMKGMFCCISAKVHPDSELQVKSMSRPPNNSEQSSLPTS